ncbi:MAG: hypothetical protein GXO70_07210 [Acidobacteria bacterium]|nr:hypothetical protein [Acidobacteriota bacterium]
MKRLTMIFTMAMMILTVTVGTFAHGDGIGSGIHMNQDGMEMEHNMVLPHIVLGGGYETELVFMNPGTGQEVSGTLYFYAQDGSDLSVIYNGISQSSIEFTVPQSGYFSLKLGTPDDPQQIAWAVFINSSDQPDADDRDMYMGDHLFVSIFYKRFDTNSDRMATQVGVMGMRFMSGMGMGYGMMVRNDDHNITGFAIVNTSDVEMTTTLTLNNPDGTTFAERNLTLLAGNQVVDILSNFFDGVADISTFEGTMEIRTDEEGMVPLGLINTDGIQTAIPMVMIPDSYDHNGNMDGSMM